MIVLGIPFDPGTRGCDPWNITKDHNFISRVLVEGTNFLRTSLILVQNYWNQPRISESDPWDSKASGIVCYNVPTSCITYKVCWKVMPFIFMHFFQWCKLLSSYLGISCVFFPVPSSRCGSVFSVCSVQCHQRISQYNKVEIYYYIFIFHRFFVQSQNYYGTWQAVHTLQYC